ncbi:MAG: hypothetical protein J3R72DRAFT_451711 [Linnemannia gamsii]|nr:MAG: hypothetical protein J3R72DRAFT_451711 [Linnemannia gamsii]
MEIDPTVTLKWDGKVTHAKRPKVLIVGGGLGGLALGMILQRSDTPYEIFERATEVQLFGSAISLTGTTTSLLKQLGIWEEFRALSRELVNIQVVNEELEQEFKISIHEEPVKRYGGESRIIARPRLYDLFLRQIPKERVHFGKKILSTQQGGNGVIIRCSDRSEYEGDILVGADGAHSAVRQNLYAQLKKEMKLPPTDDVPLPFSTVCLLGQTRPLTTDEFPHLSRETSQFVRILGENKPYTWSTFTTRNTVCYSVIQFLDRRSSKDNDSFRNSEWGSEAADAMCKEVQHFPVVSGRNETLTIGDLVNLTPKDCVVKVMLEEKVFDTWYYCRTVLIGDACHKLNPAGGSGATNAIHDAIVLANYIHALQDHPSTADIEDCFKAYQEERKPWVESAFITSQTFKSMVAKGFKAKLTRTVMKYVPKWLQAEVEKRLLSNRPQVCFLPRDDTEVTMEPVPQPSLHLKRPNNAAHQQQREDHHAAVLDDNAQSI